MAEPFKNLLNPALVQAAGAHLLRVWPRFDVRAFEQLATQGLADLEMKARAMQICAALEATLPQDFDSAADVIEAALAPTRPGEDLSALHNTSLGLAGWILWPAGEYVARRGLAQPERALAALHAITQRFTAEFAIRPFIAQHPQLCFATLQHWASDPSAHVRRLVSEGSRPRLPWGLQLKALVADPSPSLPLLLALQDDASPYVRRSVANHLNDIAKDHPALVADWLNQHLPQASAERRALLRHASRTLVKKGDARVLAAWGVGRSFKGEAALVAAPRRLRIGQSLTLTATLHSSAARAQPLVVDYAVHHVKADGSTSPKVFKGWQLALPGHESIALTRQHSMRVITTRRYYAGRHSVDLRINGTVVASASFVLSAGE